MQFWLFFCFLRSAHSKGDKKAKVEGGNCNHPLKAYKFGGANLGWKSSLITETAPVVFPCEYTTGGSKWVRLRLNKKEGPLDMKDRIMLLMASGMHCEEGARLDAKDVDSEAILCDLNEDAMTCPVENIRVSATVSDPFTQSVCVIAFCRNENLACNAEIEVEFYGIMHLESVLVVDSDERALI